MRTMNRDEVGRKYGRLTVVSRAPNDGGHNRRWLCRCDCGTTSTVREGRLRNGQTKSCGCLIPELNRKKLLIHGERNPRTKEYIAWLGMKSRCYYPQGKYYKNYGGRGITVCGRWLDSYLDFLADVGRAPSPAHTLDRKDNNGNYEPSNVRWATRAQQSNNTRRNHLIRIGDKRLILQEWANESGIDRRVISRRLKRGWSPDRAVYEPSHFTEVMN